MKELKSQGLSLSQRDGSMAKVTFHHLDNLSSIPGIPHSRRREPTLTSQPLSSTGTLRDINGGRWYSSILKGINVTGILRFIGIFPHKRQYTISWYISLCSHFELFIFLNNYTYTHAYIYIYISSYSCQMEGRGKRQRAVLIGGSYFRLPTLWHPDTFLWHMILAKIPHKWFQKNFHHHG